MLIIAITIFVLLLIYGFKNNKHSIKALSNGFLAFLASLIISGFVSFFGWKLIKLIYPEYNEILQGFTYNGHSYIWLFVLITIGICFAIYNKVYPKINTASLLVAPLSIWLIICVIIALKLKGASFFIVPVFFGLLTFFILLRQKHPSLIITAIISIPLLFIMSPFVKMFPVGLGLKILFMSSIFVVLIFGLLLPVFGYFKHKKRWSYLFFFLGFIALIKAHLNSNLTVETPKPNSLVYTLNTDTNESLWASYDTVLGDWTKNYLGENPPKANALNTIFGSKYGSGFTYTQKAKMKIIMQPKIEIAYDTIIGETRHFSICISPQRSVHRMEIFSDSTNLYKDFKVNGIDAFREEGSDYVFEKRFKNRLFSYFIYNNEPLDLLVFPKHKKQL